ncbi:ATP-dependent endonuclease [Alloscardovia macacae]|uniref:ATP-dependent endonuclease n=1 Tax=Alloscardovia macacae TaxID=1160091 RepID=A0A1Y2SYF9_9BIFI|nr:PIF1 family ATP-dependent DNA helicase [Alloscardovia macacae]OTA27417.1 ATP-dependent endonuclease [Alloscardovia macacae]OTA29429.1 ATP-dependent endonuclease [Alloscardovia macacae]
MLQSEALAIMNAGASVFLTGAPGAGKTYVLNAFVKQARAAGLSVAVTASTGIAATHLNGQTIHSYSGIGVSTFLNEEMMKRILRRKKKTLMKTDVLVIDEVSMIHAWLLDLVDEVCRLARSNSAPFGGLQVVLSGDFFQLPPVSGAKRNEDIYGTDPAAVLLRERYAADGRDREGFVTESFAWDALNPVVCYLTEQHRQDDGQLLGVLSAIRAGHVGDADRAVISGRIGVPYDDSAPITHLFPTNARADNLNTSRLMALNSEEHVYQSTSSGSAQFIERIQKNMLAPQTLVLKKGAHVMALRNDPDRQYANGSLGTVRGFMAAEKGGWPLVEFENGHVVAMKPADWEFTELDTVLATVSQVPLRCAWGITIHKSQGMTLSRCAMDLRRTFAPGMGYVALSRVQGLDGMFLAGISDAAYHISDDALLLDSSLRESSERAVDILAAHDGAGEAVQLMWNDEPRNADVAAVVHAVADEFSQGMFF